VTAADGHWRLDPSSLTARADTTDARRTSCYLTMRDGVKIAIDVHVPSDAARGARVPTILRATRYMRDVAMRGVLDVRPLRLLFDTILVTRERFVSRGYAWVDVDARGSGASGGHRPYPWSGDEVRDSGEIVDWIVQQPWSNGLVGSTGISYDGTAAEMLLVNRHPAVRAIAPRFSLWDTYADVAFPGGIHLAWFTEAWARFNRTLDENRFHSAVAQALWLMARTSAQYDPVVLRRRVMRAATSLGERRFVQVVGTTVRSILAGVRPVDDDPRGLGVRTAMADHRQNFSVHEGAMRVTFRDDVGLSAAHPDETMDAFSPHAFAKDIAASDAAIYSSSGWRDGAYQNSACKRFMNVRTNGSRLLLGPWNHGGRLFHPGDGAAVPTAFDHDGELVRFFDLHLRGHDDSLADDPPVRYFTMIENRWKTASTWPPPNANVRPFYLSTHRGLRETPPEPVSDGDTLRVEPRGGSGDRSRWKGLLGPFIPADYPDRTVRDARLLTYDSPPLETEICITGHPVAVMFVRSSTPDAFLFVYLEAVTPDGDVRYITEGQLRFLHRAIANESPDVRSAVPVHSYRRADGRTMGRGDVAEVAIELLPTSYLVREGHRLRVSLAGADADHFRAPPDAGGSLDVFRSRAWASRIELPIMPRG